MIATSTQVGEDTVDVRKQKVQSVVTFSNSRWDFFRPREIQEYSLLRKFESQTEQKSYIISAASAYDTRVTRDVAY